MHNYESLGFFDFEDFVEELTDEQLFAINGGSCAGGAPSGGHGPTGGGSCGGGYNPSYNPGPSNPPSCPTPTSSCGGGYMNNTILVTSSFSRTTHSHVENVGVVTDDIKQTCFTDKNNKLTINNFGLFCQKDASGVDSYTFGGKIKLIINGEVRESKFITPPTGSNIWDGTRDFIGTVTFDTLIPNYGSIQIQTDIDMVINNASVDFLPKTQTLR